MSEEPVRPIKEKVEAVDIDPESHDRVIIKIPLNKNPELAWEYMFENPKVMKGPIYSQKVRGDQIMVKANKERPKDAVEQIYEYIDSTNNRYEEFLEKNKDKFVDVNKEELEEITEKIREE